MHLQHHMTAHTVLHHAPSTYIRASAAPHESTHSLASQQQHANSRVEDVPDSKTDHMHIAQLDQLLQLQLHNAAPLGSPQVNHASKPRDRTARPSASSTTEGSIRTAQLLYVPTQVPQPHPRHASREPGTCAEPSRRVLGFKCPTEPCSGVK